mmetsp:Transcript_591/g.1286  ORF Transcript_591/g.1286 Transcript_591/m.1286 type:complete len:90 (+) Transcript_591:1171-1440(+)
MDAPPRAQVMGQGMHAVRDLGSCSDPFQVAPFLDAKKGKKVANGSSTTDLAAQRGSAALTPCDAAADAPGAYPIRYFDWILLSRKGMRG